VFRVYYCLNVLIGTKVKIELDRAKDSFVIMKYAADTNNYKLKLLYIALYMPIAQLSQSVATEINSVLTKDNPVKIQYRNIEIRPYTIPKDSPNYYSELLFSDIVPARIVVVFVETASKNGSQTKNPFNLRRRWTVKVEPPPPPPPKPDGTYDQESTEKRLREVEETNKLLLQNLQILTDHLKSLTPTPKGKGRGKSSTRASTSASVTNNLQNVTLNDLAAETVEDTRMCESSSASTSNRSTRLSQGGAASNSDFSVRSTDIQDVFSETTKEIFIKSIDLTINGASIDQGRSQYHKTFMANNSLLYRSN